MMGKKYQTIKPFFRYYIFLSGSLNIINLSKDIIQEILPFFCLMILYDCGVKLLILYSGHEPMTSPYLALSYYSSLMWCVRLGSAMVYAQIKFPRCLGGDLGVHIYFLHFMKL